MSEDGRGTKQQISAAEGSREQLLDDQCCISTFHLIMEVILSPPLHSVCPAACTSTLTWAMSAAACRAALLSMRATRAAPSGEEEAAAIIHDGGGSGYTTLRADATVPAI